MCKGESDDMTTEPKRPVNKRPVNKAAGKSVNQKPVNKKPANRKPVRYEDPEPVKYKKKKPHHSKKKKGKSKRSKILLFIVEIFVLLIMVVVLYSVLKIEKVGKVDLPKEEQHEGIPEYCAVWCRLHKRSSHQKYAKRYHHDCIH